MVCGRFIWVTASTVPSDAASPAEHIGMMKLGGKADYWPQAIPGQKRLSKAEWGQLLADRGT